MNSLSLDINGKKVKSLTRQNCEDWKSSDGNINPITGKQLEERLKTIVRKRCAELGIHDRKVSPIVSPRSAIKNRKTMAETGKSMIETGRSLSEPNTNEIKDMKHGLPVLFELSFANFEKMRNDNDRVDAVLLKYNITDKRAIRNVKKFIKYILNIPNAKRKDLKELSEIVKSRKYRKLSLFDLGNDSLNIILSKYEEIMKPRYKLRDWIPEEKVIDYLNYDFPGTIDILHR